jgi:hypothetical protein
MSELDFAVDGRAFGLVVAGVGLGKVRLRAKYRTRHLSGASTLTPTVHG